MNKNSLISAVFILVLCTTALGYEGQDFFGEYAIMMGEPNIDGVISPGEWDSANWLDLDQVYNGDARDLSDANWAALWSPETNCIYVVVTGKDTVQIFGDEYGALGWNQYDQAEVYIDIGNNETTTYYSEGYQVREPAHQWMCGNDNYGGSWVVQPEEFTDPDPPPPLPEEIRPLLVTSIDGDVLTYELAIPPYEWIGWLTDATMNLRQLETDMRIGLDVIMSSKSTSFGMLCENAWRGDEDFNGDEEPDGIITIDKWQYAERYLDHSLIADPNQAWRPRPANKAVGMPGEVTLQWNAGKNAAYHEVYFGTSFDDVNNADNSDTTGIYRGPPQALGNTTHTPVDNPLKLGTTYYWRIDEVNSAHPGQSWKGNIWRFTIRDYLVVDDFDSYASTEEIIGDGYEIPTIWADGYTDTNPTNSYLFLETDIVRDGNSVRFGYYDDYVPIYYSEVKANIADLGIYSDWLSSGVKALSLWFYGQPGNSATVNDEMYAALEDTGGKLAVVFYDGDANDVKLEIWQEWNISLEEFNEANEVDLSSVASIYIGFGDRYGAVPGGGTGDVYFDDIVLYLPRCIPAFAEGDATGDCFTGLDDLKIMAGDWLESDFTVPVTAPTGELVWYKFDNEGTNNKAVDSSGNGYDGTVSGAAWTTEGAIDGALSFDGNTTQVDVPIAALTSIEDQVTVALWQYGNPMIQPKADNLFEGRRVYSNSVGIRVINAHVPYSDEMIVWCAGNPNEVYDANVWADCERIEKGGSPKEYEGRWNHWTFIKDCDANGGAGELKMYLNGFLWDSGYDVNVPLTGTIDKEFLIGNGADGFYAGVIDDFRIYDKVLTQEEISYLATMAYPGEGYYPLQDRETNFNEQGESAEKIDLMDFARMADYWFQDQFWP